MPKRTFHKRGPVAPQSPESGLPAPRNDEPRRRVGRPRFYETPEELEAALDAAIAARQQREEPLTWYGLTLDLGFSDDDALGQIARRAPEFDAVIKRARRIVIADYERDLRTKYPVGAIFALKNLAGWSDRQEIEQRTVSARLDLSRLTDDQLRRVLGGENPLQVLVESGALKQLPAGQPLPDKPS